MKIKTVDVITLKWFDKINANTYFAQKIILNQGMKNQEIIINKIRYGYSSYSFRAMECLKEHGYFQKSECLDDLENKIAFRFFERYALKRELKNIGDE